MAHSVDPVGIAVSSIVIRKTGGHEINQVNEVLRGAFGRRPKRDGNNGRRIRMAVLISLQKLNWVAGSRFFLRFISWVLKLHYAL